MLYLYRDAVVFATKHPGSSTPEMRRKIPDNSIYPDRTRTNSTSSQSDGERLTTMAKTIYENEAIVDSITKVVVHSPSRSEEKIGNSKLSVPNFENIKFRKVNSLPDISRRVSLLNRPNFRDRISSGDSDITILNDASESSVGTVQQYMTISSSSDDGGLCSIMSTNTAAQNDEKNKNSEHSPCHDDRDRTLGQHSTIKEVAPMGSPLSNSVCSSMVSSVYQNALGDALEYSSLPYTGNLDKGPSIEKILDDTDGANVSQNVQTDKVIHHYSDDDIYSTSGNRTQKTFRKASYENSTSYDSAENESTINPKSATFYVGSPESTRSSKDDSTSLDLSLSMDTSLDASRDNEKTIKWNYEDFTQIDHRLKLHIMMNLFDGEAEVCECILMVSAKF